MPRRYLPLLNFSEHVTASAARQDKIQLTFQHGLAVDSPGDIARFLEYLGPLPRNSGQDAETYGRIFNQPTRGEPPFAIQLIRQRQTARPQPYPVPLFEGHLEIENPRRDTNALGESVWEFQTILSINPTRFLRHQELPRRAVLYGEEPVFEYDLFRAETPPDTLDEYSLQRETDRYYVDNWIPDSRFWARFASQQFWPTHLAGYLCGVEREIQRDIDRAAQNQTVVIVRPDRPFSLSTVETYFEFYWDGPIGMVMALKLVLEEFVNELRADSYPVAQLTHERIENSQCLTVQMGVGITLKIYAKTNRRIRFEITHRLNGDVPYRLNSGRHTFAQMGDIQEALAELAGDAATRLNRVFDFINTSASFSGPQKSVIQFITEITSACNNAGMASELLELLRWNRSINARRGASVNAVFGNVLEKLVNKNVLLRGRSRYSVAPAYQAAHRALMYHNGIGSILNLHPRRRSPLPNCPPPSSAQ